eukprot:CAMPEP_0183313564 /NCGR_PEP_ID=MMETSP0160_2-20130417/45720_1 /TAXON_ID=2839 ORGANISM="Odontella Sinensis, Strain Grunow 1884" /NCGR_SAMPLE_ID=MMETSP0160_2 /ASSEMBLY_ACC=CAM_ASM_000250 /LENGTH=146 /DNA_ID=CAMNT_0025478675 /DNA_START=567 /DNA_END=1007 /DNA_ORIENTATION=+
MIIQWVIDGTAERLSPKSAEPRRRPGTDAVRCGGQRDDPPRPSGMRSGGDVPFRSARQLEPIAPGAGAENAVPPVDELWGIPSRKFVVVVAVAVAPRSLLRPEVFDPSLDDFQVLSRPETNFTPPALRDDAWFVSPDGDAVEQVEL